MKVLRHNNRIVNSGQGSPILTYTKPVEIEAFTTVWDTRNLNGTGENPTNTVLELPISDTDGWYYSGQRFDFTVDWGDGSSSVVTSHDDPNRIHTYAEPGIKEIYITGKFGGFVFSAHWDKTDMLLEIKKWNSVELDSVGYMFEACSNLEITATDAPTFANWVSGGHANDAYEMFRDCTNLINSNFIAWDVTPLMTTDFSLSYMFANVNFESPNFSNWNINGDFSLINEGFSFMFNNVGSNFNPIGLDTWVIPATASGNNSFSDFFGGTNEWNSTQIPSTTYDAILNAWSQNAINNDGPYNIDIGFGNSKYSSASVTARDILINTYGWAITDDGQI